MDKLRVLDLFSGIGGFSLGLERTGGFETVAFCEIEEFPRRVLAKHWPDVPCYDDVRTLTAARLAADGISVDVICGGFPCQDISFAGNGAGLAGERSGLWSEIRRLAGDIRPKLVILENVGALLSRGLDAVLGHLAALGYDAEWHCIPASALGAPHRRDRIWIVAYPAGDGWSGSASGYQDGNSAETRAIKLRCEPAGSRATDVSRTLADALSIGLQGSWKLVVAGNPTSSGEGQASDALNGGFGAQWGVEPNVGRVADGVPDRAHRLKALGNAVVPQITELIGNAILRSMREAA